MKVRDVMKRSVLAVSPGSQYEEAARIMYMNRLSGLPVVDDGGKVVGVISEKDLFRALYPSYLEFAANPEIYCDQEAREQEIEDLRRSPVEMFMSSPACTIEQDAPVLRAGGLMLARGIHRLVVVDEDRIAGIVTRREIYAAILEEHLSLRRENTIARAANE